LFVRRDLDYLLGSPPPFAVLLDIKTPLRSRASLTLDKEIMIIDASGVILDIKTIVTDPRDTILDIKAIVLDIG
jgi:hypothetical protein